MTSEKTRIKNFEFYLHQIEGIYKIISGPDFNSVGILDFVTYVTSGLLLRTLTCHLPENIDSPYVL